jgi:hypothetical protein
MPSPENKFDPELLQARWVLGGIRSDELPDLAVLALQHGFMGMALQYLAGLTRPTLADLENLPERAFADLGLKPMDRDAAVTCLMARGILPTSAAMSVLLESFPDFLPRWRKHVAYWGESTGSYSQMAEFVHFVVEDLYEKRRTDEVGRAFAALEKILAEADQETKNLIALGFFERLQNFVSRRPYDAQVFGEFLGKRSMPMWRNLRKIWAGNPVRAEREK